MERISDDDLAKLCESNGFASVGDNGSYVLEGTDDYGLGVAIRGRGRDVGRGLPVRGAILFAAFVLAAVNRSWSTMPAWQHACLIACGALYLALYGKLYLDDVLTRRRRNRT